MRSSDPEPLVAESRLVYPGAGLVSRMLAYGCDLVIMFALAAFALKAIHEYLLAPGFAYALSVLLMFVLQWGYGTSFDWLVGGRSPGKALLGLRAVREDGGGMGFQAAVARNLLRPLDALPGLYATAFAMAYLDDDTRRVGDIVAGTRVVREEAVLRALPEPLNRRSEADVHDYLSNALSEFLNESARLTPAARSTAFSQVASGLTRVVGWQCDGVASAEETVRAYHKHIARRTR